MHCVQRAPAFVAFAVAMIVSGLAFGVDNRVVDDSPRVLMPGHTLDALPKASLIANQRASEALSLTIVLRRTDEDAFQKYLSDVYDPNSTRFRKFLTPQQIADEFGPTPEDYATVSYYFQANGFSLEETSANRMTLVVSGSRSAAEMALSVQVRDYQLGDRKFFASATDPALPSNVASRVQAVIGLSNLAIPARANWNSVFKNPICNQKAQDQLQKKGVNFGNVLSFNDNSELFTKKVNICLDANKESSIYETWNWHFSNDKDPPPPSYVGVDGTGQKIGLVEFDTFLMSDVSDFANLSVLQPATTLGNISQVHVSGGATAGAQQAEVLLDIDDVITAAPGAQVAVYDAPFSGAGSFQAVFNAMINGGVTVISNSWTYCEDQTTLSDVQSIESVLQTAAAAGISVLSATGDFGSSCWNGSANTAQVPTTSPHITAVGGTSPTFGPGFTYTGETWWDGSASSPPSGQGGFGTSRFFASPAYQMGISSAAMRSVPDITGPADPSSGVTICQASGGGCPTDALFGGTSSATPIWAAWVAVLNQAQGANLGFLNSAFYPLAATNAFHNAASMGTDFAHVGLGTPNVARLHQRLTNQTSGSTDPGISELHAFLPEGIELPKPLEPLLVPADGTSNAYLVVRSWDAMGNIVAGHMVTIAASPGAHVTISAVPSSQDGIAIFSVSDSTAETVTFSATDLTAGITLLTARSVGFTVPPATAGGILASPSSVPADGSSSSTITITLKDALNQPTPGKQISLSQGTGHSIITGPNPAVTDANGQIQFTATDNVSETVTYTAIDVTDGNLPVPGSAAVTFTGGSTSCVTSAPTPAPGFTLEPFANGFAAQNFFYSNVNWGNCPGASNPAFDTSGNVFVSDFYNGKLFKFGPSGGAVSSANALATIGQTLQQPVFGQDGSLYVARGATGSGLNSGTVLRVDPGTGTVLQTLVSGLTCPSPLAVDPLSGDLFFTDTCFGGGADNPSLWRIQNPAGQNPALVVYTTLPSTPNGAIAFAPNGTMYVVNNYNGSGNIIQVAGTNAPSPPAMTTLSGISSDFWITMGEVQSNGAAKSLLVHNNNALKLVDITTTPFTTTVLANGSLGSGSIGPDGCLYAEASDTIFKLAPASGMCGFTPTNPGPALVLSPALVSPNPPQGTATTITARFMNVSVPAGTPVSFNVSGANVVFKSVTTDATGAATFTYMGRDVGRDAVMAYGSPNPGVLPALISNTASVTWGVGKHVSQMYLNTAPSGSNAGQPVVLVAAVFDVSLDPQGPIAGVPVQMNIGSNSCTGTTNANGLASCSLTLLNPGNFTFAATFAGNATYATSSASQGFTVLAAVAGATAGLAYTPVTPCRLVDTRNAVGPLTPRAGRNYAASDNTRIGQAGGNAAGCGIPVGPEALALTLTAVQPTQVGNLVAFPSGDAVPLASALNFLAGQIIANTTVVPITQGAGDNFSIFNNSDGMTPVVVDVVGYFWEYLSSDCTKTTQSLSVGAGSTIDVPATCAVGYVPVGGGCSTDTPGASNWLVRTGTPPGDGYHCTMLNGFAGSVNVSTDTMCCRKAGR
jgi:kumamolisin